MRRFFIDSELWIIPISLFFAVFSVMGLQGFSKVKQSNITEPVTGIPLKDIYEQIYTPDAPNQIYCRSRLFMKEGLLRNNIRKEVVSNVVYDPIYYPWAVVDLQTLCEPASSEFKNISLEMGFKWMEYKNHE